jgi:hypothetical protein
VDEDACWPWNLKAVDPETLHCEELRARARDPDKRQIACPRCDVMTQRREEKTLTLLGPTGPTGPTGSGVPGKVQEEPVEPRSAAERYDASMDERIGEVVSSIEKAMQAQSQWHTGGVSLCPACGWMNIGATG